MGMYTGLICKCTLTDKGREAVESFYTLNKIDCEERMALKTIQERLDLPWRSAWRQMCEMYKGTTAEDWAEVGRADFIPHGSSAYLEFEREEFLKEKGWTRGLDGDVWVISCELKNYESEIEKFLRDVLPHLVAEPCVAYTRYEEERDWSEETIRPARMENESGSE